MSLLNEIVHGDWRKTWQKDLLASLVVFLVALPLCMGIALASGAPVAAGLVTGIIGGLIVGSFSGSPLQVSGPAAGLTVVCGEIIREHGLPAMGVIVMMGGAIQLVAGIFKLGQWFRAVSPAVVEGMLAGIGLTILAKQFHVMVDDEAPKGVFESLATIPQAVWKAFDPPPGADANHSEAAVIGLLAILALALWKTVAPGRLKIVPAAIVGGVLLMRRDRA